MNKEAVISEYAKKIYGFAYSKTQNTHNAEDLSQEILLQLLDTRQNFDAIENMDAYIYRICCYTWSNYLRENKPVWNMHGTSDALQLVPSGEDMQQKVIDQELHEQLRREIMYLSRTRREIMILYYYENKRGDEIAELLKIPASTVRWHMSQTKTILKERIQMTEQTGIYKPVKLDVGHNGWVKNSGMHGLGSDLIVQNICIICREKPLSIEEIARTLGIAAVYLESHIEKLLYMDYLKEVGKNKYQTTFYISGTEDYIAHGRFQYENIMKIAEPLYQLTKKLLPIVREKNLVYGEFDDNFLMYALLMPFANCFLEQLQDAADEKMDISWTRPKRKDGSEHFVGARFPIEIPEKLKQDAEFYDFLQKYDGYGAKVRSLNNISSLQCDLYAFGRWRDFDGDDLLKLIRIQTIAQCGEVPNEYDKEAIALMCQKGYVKVVDEKPVILVPILDSTGAQDVLSDLAKACCKEEMQAIESKFPELVDLLVTEREKRSVAFSGGLDQNERNYQTSLSAYYSEFAVIYALMMNGYLREPTKEEKKRICTMVFVH